MKKVVKGKEAPVEKERVPLFGSWKAWYLVVIGFLALLIVLFYMITKTFS